jgi:uncharacterized alkaline shock family protein YloU
VPGQPITISVDVAVFQGENIPLVADRLRQEMFSALGRYTELVVATIDITVSDVHVTPDV